MNLRSLHIFAFLFLLFSSLNLNAATITATTDGSWQENIWSDVAGPQAGDEIIIPAGVKVYINTLIDLSTPGNNVATTIIIDGELMFYDAVKNCFIGCEVGLKLDEPSVVTVNEVNGFIETDLGNTATQLIYFGNTPIYLSFPWGPGTISIAGMILPVELISFEGETKARVNNLNWITATEEYTSHFVVERSLNGVDNFEVLGRVEAQGFSEEVQGYSFRDDNPESMAYYRLIIVDFDGSKTKSDIVALERGEESVDVEVFPNPVIEDVNVSVNLDKAGPVEINVFDPSGKLIQSHFYNMEDGKNKVNFQLNGAKHQMFLITITNGNKQVTKKVMNGK